MLQLLQSNLMVAAGAILALVLMAIRAASNDKPLRRDLQGAILYLVSFLLIRFVGDRVKDLVPDHANKVVRVAWLVALSFGLIRAGVSLALAFLRVRSSVPTPKIVRDVIDVVLYAIAAITIFKSQLDVDLSGVLATSAVLSVVIGLALQDTLGNLFAGLSIQLERPFQVGDYVSIGEHTGKVLQVAWRATRMETFRREVITLPNSILSKTPVKNFSRASQPVGIDLYVHLSYEAPPNAVREAMMQTITSVPNVLSEPGCKVRVWGYDENGVKWQVRYFVADYLHADNAMDEFYTRLWYRLRREGIEIPYPQRTLHFKEAQPQQEVPDERVAGLLDSVEIFAVLDRRAREELRKEMQLRRFGRGERIIQEGAQGHTFYLVVSGEVSVRAGSGDAEVARLKRGQYFGEMSLLTGEPRAATVLAASDAVLLELDRPVFARLFGEHQGLARELSAILAQRRSQLKAAAEAAGGSAEIGREAGRIFSRLKQIFGLKGE
ncbi:MAG TPA: mechanosensitive ion channel family protein [Myxococcaceae bacterium]|nr:mechanosensitive ion channel family protein [Myxococcaceae bacterium]